MSRPSKIGRLSAATREELNRRLEAGEMGKELVRWLNAHAQPESPHLERIPTPGAPITEQNVSDWRNGGFLEWQLRRELLEASGHLGEAFADLGSLSLSSEQFLVCLNARFASNLLAWDGTSASKALHNMQILQRLLLGVLGLRRSEQQAARLALDRERFEFTRETRNRRPAAEVGATTHSSGAPIAPPSPQAAPPPPPAQFSRQPLRSISPTASTAVNPPSSAPATILSPGFLTPPLQSAPSDLEEPVLPVAPTLIAPPRSRPEPSSASAPTAQRASAPEPTVPKRQLPHPIWR